MSRELQPPAVDLSQYSPIDGESNAEFSLHSQKEGEVVDASRMQDEAHALVPQESLYPQFRPQNLPFIDEQPSSSQSESPLPPACYLVQHYASPPLFDASSQSPQQMLRSSPKVPEQEAVFNPNFDFSHPPAGFSAFEGPNPQTNYYSGYFLRPSPLRACDRCSKRHRPCSMFAPCSCCQRAGVSCTYNDSFKRPSTKYTNYLQGPYESVNPSQIGHRYSEVQQLAPNHHRSTYYQPTFVSGNGSPVKGSFPYINFDPRPGFALPEGRPVDRALHLERSPQLLPKHNQNASQDWSPFYSTHCLSKANMLATSPNTNSDIPRTEVKDLVVGNLDSTQLLKNDSELQSASLVDIDARSAVHRSLLQPAMTSLDHTNKPQDKPSPTSLSQNVKSGSSRFEYVILRDLEHASDAVDGEKSFLNAEGIRLASPQLSFLNQAMDTEEDLGNGRTDGAQGQCFSAQTSTKMIQPCDSTIQHRHDGQPPGYYSYQYPEEHTSQFQLCPEFHASHGAGTLSHMASPTTAQRDCKVVSSPNSAKAGPRPPLSNQSSSVKSQNAADDRHSSQSQQRSTVCSTVEARISELQSQWNDLENQMIDLTKFKEYPVFGNSLRWIEGSNAITGTSADDDGSTGLMLRLGEENLIPVTLLYSKGRRASKKSHKSASANPVPKEQSSRKRKSSRLASTQACLKRQQANRDIIVDPKEDEKPTGKAHFPSGTRVIEEQSEEQFPQTTSKPVTPVPESTEITTEEQSPKPENSSSPSIFTQTDSSSQEVSVIQTGDGGS